MLDERFGRPFVSLRNFADGIDGSMVFFVHISVITPILLSIVFSA